MKSKNNISFEDWSAELAKMTKKYPLVKNKWKISRFRKMHKEGLSIELAFRCWFCGH